MIEIFLSIEPKIPPYTRIPNDILFDDTLSPIERLVLFMLASLNPCFPSYPYLAKMGHCSTRAVLRAMKVLLARGLVAREKRGRGYFYCVVWQQRQKIIRPIGDTLSPIQESETSKEDEETYSVSPEEAKMRIQSFVKGIRNLQ